VFGMGTGVAPPATPPGTSLRSAMCQTLRIFAHGSCVRIPVPIDHETLACDSEPRCKLHTATPKAIPSSPRPISTGKLKALRPLHPRPINQVVLLGSYPVSRWEA
jgi:hypothetical protein